MHLSYVLSAIAALCSSVALADFTTPTYPTPADLSSNYSLVHAGWKNLTSTWDWYLQGKLNVSAAAAFAGVENVTFSVGLFSLNDPLALKLQYHYTTPEVKTALVGTRKVDEDSIYRVASVSKLITTFAGLLELDDKDWHRPLAQINPAFKRQRKNATAVDVIKTIEWDKITPWALASHLSGLPTLGFLGDSYNESLASVMGGPVVNTSTLGACVAKLYNDPSSLDCSTAEIISSLRDLPPNFLPWSTPVYSDLNFMILGLVISDLTNKSIADVYRSSVFSPLNMSSSSTKSQNATLPREVVVGAPAAYLALDAFPSTVPAGGVLSSLGDLQRLGLGILNNTLLPAEATRRWMKPVSHTPSLSYSIGAPWEIYRFVHPGTGHVTDIYTKLGDAGNHGAALALIPQYDAGFAFLNAASAEAAPLRSDIALGILDAVTATVLPALEAEALAEARRNFIGEYKSLAGGKVAASLTVGFNASTDPTDVHSGLVITEWTYNGTDILKVWFGSDRPRLEQSIVRHGEDGKPRQVAFIASTYHQTPTYEAAGTTGPWTGFYYSNGDFVYTDQQRWAGQPVRELVFELDGKGAAVKCTPLYQGIELTKAKKKN